MSQRFLTRVRPAGRTTSPRRLVALAIQFTLLAGLVVGTAGFVALGKTVTVSVDGAPRQLHTYAATVGGVLSQAGLSVGAHDVVTPDPGSQVRDHARVVLRRGRLLTLRIDNQPRNVWVTATSVAEAMDELGLGDAGAFISASRSRSIGLAGGAFAIRLPQHVEVVADGKAHPLTTTEPTVTEVVRDAHVALAATDRLSVSGRVYPLEGLVIRVTRVRGQFLTESSAIPHAVIQEPNANMYVGTSRVVHDGLDGVLVQTYKLVFIDHRLVSRTLVRSVVASQPQSALVDYGTQPVPQPTYGDYGHYAGLNWQGLANCESGGNPRSVSPGGEYRGLYQFAQSTWYSVGGSGDPIDASASEQTYRAEILYSRSGRSAWPVCGQYL